MDKQPTPASVEMDNFLKRRFIGQYNSEQSVLTFNQCKKAMIEYMASLQSQLLQKETEVKELKAWKESAISVMPDIQAIGKALGVKLGESIHDKILPGIEYWKALAEAAEAMMNKMIFDNRDRETEDDDLNEYLSHQEKWQALKNQKQIT